MFNNKTKIMCFVFLIACSCYASSVRAYTISAHVVRFWGLTYLAVQTFNYANPLQSIWTLYSSGVNILAAMQSPLFILINAELNHQKVLIDPLTGRASMGALTGVIMSPLWPQAEAIMLHDRIVIQPQQMTFEVLNSVYFQQGAASLPTIPE